MNKRFWSHKRVLVTGFEGFLGSNLTKKLLTTGASLAGVDVKSRQGQYILSKKDYDRLKIYQGNVANHRWLTRVIKNFKPQIVFHLAAEAIVERSLQNPQKAFVSNIGGTWSLLEACRQQPGIEAIVIASSDKAYGSHDRLPYRESSRLNGQYPYDVSKSCSDLIANTYHCTYGLPVAVTRCGNIFGPGDLNFSRIVPDTIRSIIHNKTVKIRSDGTFTRDYVYVNDILDGYILLAENLQKLKLSGEAFNFSYGNPMSVIALIKKLYAVADCAPNYQILREARYEIKHQYLSCVKARRILGWRPTAKLESALKETMNWYEQHLAR